MFITKKKYEKALAAERERGHKESEEHQCRWEDERGKSRRIDRLEKDVAKLKAAVYNKPKKWWQRRKKNEPLSDDAPFDDGWF